MQDKGEQSDDHVKNGKEAQQLLTLLIGGYCVGFENVVDQGRTQGAQKYQHSQAAQIRFLRYNSKSGRFHLGNRVPVGRGRPGAWKRPQGTQPPGAEKVHEGQKREHRRYTQQNGHPFGHNSPGQTSHCCGTGNTTDPLLGRSRVEPLVDHRPESGDQESTDHGQMKIKCNGGNPWTDRDHPPLGQQKDSTDSKAPGNQSLRTQTGHSP